MKGNKKQIFLIVSYLAFLSLLLILQYCYIDGKIPRLLSNGIALLLAFPCLFFMREWKNAALPDTEREEQEPDRELTRNEFLECAAEYSLTRRETEVAWLIYRKYTNSQIGEELFISETTVKKHAGHIYEKMSVNGRKELAEIIEDKRRKNWDGKI